MDHTTVSEFQTTTHTPQKKNTDQLMDSESQTTTHTLHSQKKNMDHTTVSEFQTTTHTPQKKNTGSEVWLCVELAMVFSDSSWSLEPRVARSLFLASSVVWSQGLRGRCFWQAP